MKKIIYLAGVMFLAALISVIPMGTTDIFADQEKEELVAYSFLMGYYDIWYAPGSGWTAQGKPGDKDKKVMSGSFEPMAFRGSVGNLSGIKDNYQLTRLEIVETRDFNEALYKEAGSRWSDRLNAMATWDEFDNLHYDHIPNNLRAEVASLNLEEASARLQWTLDLPNRISEGIAPRGPRWEALNLVMYQNLIDPEFLHPGYTPGSIAPPVEGYRFYTPTIAAWYGVPINVTPPDFSVEFEQYIYDNMKPGTVIEGIAKFKLNEDHPQPETAKLTLVHKVGNTEWQVTLTAIKPENTLPANGVIEFKPGEIKEYRFTITVLVKDTLLRSLINPVSVNTDSNWSNNRAEAHIFVLQPPPLNPLLNFQAVSKGGQNAQGTHVPSVSRTPNTARWSDTVAANFRAPGPPPPINRCYSLKKWELRSATIKYPKVHPEFTFGSPEEPKGTVSKRMSVNSSNNTATTSFIQDWSVNGAQIFDAIRGQMVPGPTNYNISVDYLMDWHYTICTPSCCGEDKCSPCCVSCKDVETTRSGTITAQLLVDGTGLNPLAQ